VKSRYLVAALALLTTSAAVIAQPADPIAARQALMKGNGKDIGAALKMIKGEEPFDAAKAQMIFANMNAVAMKFGNYFPANSQTGGDTEAAPAIWTKPADFKTALVKFQTDTAAATAAKPATLDAFKAAFGPVAGNCRSCHESFRIKKD
jgi:cytochrome c556